MNELLVKEKLHTKMGTRSFKVFKNKGIAHQFIFQKPMENKEQSILRRKTNSIVLKRITDMLYQKEKRNLESQSEKF